MTDGSRSNTATKILLIVVAIVLLPVVFRGGMMGGAGMMEGLMFLWPVLLVGLVVVLVSGVASGPGTRDPDRAMTILRERYARGELSEEQFEERKRRLRSKNEMSDR